MLTFPLPQARCISATVTIHSLSDWLMRSLLNSPIPPSLPTPSSACGPVWPILHCSFSALLLSALAIYHSYRRRKKQHRAAFLCCFLRLLAIHPLFLLL